jgi:hypothetical protein
MNYSNNNNVNEAPLQEPVAFEGKKKKKKKFSDEFSI